MGASRVQSTGKGWGEWGFWWTSSQPAFGVVLLFSKGSLKKKKKPAECNWLASLYVWFPASVLSELGCEVVQHRVYSVCLWASLNATQKPCTVTDLWRCRIPGLWVKFPSSPGLNNVCSQTMNRPLAGLFKRWSTQVFNGPYRAVNVQLIACNFVYHNGWRPHGDLLWG